ncbi:MAG: phenylalanine--tRNA ligase subunit beta [Elusimicrobia bacterium HGW-Elusimicrobia-4]|nr:MAG: phenylalanine--tRNA ligase subunit beta [Elusimicrobia bacterium HGW-Elusimicrobia-4]
MKISLNWLKEFVDIDVSVDELAYRLTMAGIETEVVKNNFIDKNVVITKILSVEKHPNADKLSVCEVTDGQNNYKIVCGANNIKAGDVVPLAKLGTKLLAGEIKKAVLRGVESQGMLCSPVEIKAGDDASGIFILPVDAKIGLTLDEYLNSDPSIETEVTINRGDCLSVFGIAREISAVFNKIIKKEIKDYSIKPKNIFPVEISAEGGSASGGKNPEKCPRYTGFIIKNITVGPSPKWIIDRLTNCGLRPINNVVDITNYILLEYGQPLHAFDIAQLKNKIIVRNAKKGEKILALDNNEYSLDDEMLVIADEDVPVAIAGVIGGTSTSVTDATKNIFLEAAYFDPISIRKTSRKLAISTDSSYRFIRGIDAKNVSNIAMLAAEMIRKICGGEIVEGAVDIYPNPSEPIKIELDINRVNKILGAEISIDEIKNILSRLGFIYSLLPTPYSLSVTVPSHRNDVKDEIDLVEEIARIYGYNNIKTSDKISYRTNISAADKTEQIIDRIKDVAVSAGFFETVSYNFISKEDLLKLKLKESEWEIKNPVSMEEPFLTTSLIPQLIQNAIRNFNRGKNDIKFFEIGRVFLEKEQTFFSGCVSGCETGWWKGKPSPIGFYFLKGFIETVFTEIGISDYRFEKNAFEMFHKNQSVKIKISDKTVGHFGLLAPDIKNEMDLKTDLYVFEIVLDELADFTDFGKKYVPVPKYPSVERDLAVEVSQNFSADEITGVIKKEGDDILSEIKLFDFYEGVQIKEGHKSLAFNMTFIRKDRTLKDEEVNTAIKKIISQLEKKFSAKIR